MKGFSELIAEFWNRQARCESGFATGLRVSLFPIVADLGERYPQVEFVISEYEPIEAFALLTDDDLDLALTYDCNLAPASIGPVLETVPLWSVAWALGVPANAPDGPANIADFADHTWIVNSRNTADEDAVPTLAAMAGFTPKTAHQIDSLDLVEDLIVAGYRIGLLRVVFYRLRPPPESGLPRPQWPRPVP